MFLSLLSNTQDTFIHSLELMSTLTEVFKALSVDCLLYMSVRSEMYAAQSSLFITHASNLSEVVTINEF